MDIVVIVLLVLLGAIVLTKGKPLYQFLIKLWNSRAYPYFIIGSSILLILGITRTWGLNTDVLIGAGIIVGVMFAVLYTNPNRDAYSPEWISDLDWISTIGTIIFLLFIAFNIIDFLSN